MVGNDEDARESAADLRLKGVLDASEARSFWQQARVVVRERAGARVVVDGGEALHVGGAVLQLLLAVSRELARGGGSLTLVNASPSVAKTFTLAGLGGLLENEQQPAHRKG